MNRLLACLLVAISVVACAQSGSELNADLTEGREIYRDRCATCHGGNGEGGAGPALAEVIETFSSCNDQMQWISLGSKEFKSQVGPAYGDQEKEITGVMPQFSTSLTADEIARVAAYERQRVRRRHPDRRS